MSEPNPPPSIFRKEAVDLHHSARGGTEGALIRLYPSWLGWSYRLLGGVLAASVLFISIGTLNEYADGPALVQLAGQEELSARVAGTVVAVEVVAGQKIEPGQVLVRFDTGQELAELTRLEQELEISQIQSLRSRGDVSARQALGALQAQRDLARSRLEDRTVRAAHRARVSDVRIRPGQHLSVGELLVDLARDDAPYTVTAMLPGHYRPMLKPGGMLRLELSGYRYAYQALTIDSVGDEVVGPSEVRRFLGQATGDAVELLGPTVLVRGTLPAPGFTVDGRYLSYYPGMLGRAEAEVRRESILVTLFPWVRSL